MLKTRRAPSRMATIIRLAFILIRRQFSRCPSREVATSTREQTLRRVLAVAVQPPIDIPQGRAYIAAEAAPKRTPAEKELYVDPQYRAFYSSQIPPETLYPRVVLRFADEKNLWISGMLAGSSELAGAPAVIDVPLGRGHVVLFANNPMWRQETQGSFMLVLNAALNFDHLDAGRKLPAAAKPQP